MSIKAAALKIATSQLGVQEVPRGSNDGPEVSQYLRAVGLEPGYAWCMAFVYWAVGKAAAQAGVQNPLIKTGGVAVQMNKTTLPKLSVNSKAIAPGDVFIMEFKSGFGHTGFVKEIKGDSITTIEGNTNSDGSREGYEVASRTRKLVSFKGFIQIP